MRLKDCVVVITGASSGIGRATALHLAGKGARLVLAARGEKALQTLAKECRRRGGKAIPIAADVTDPDAMEALASRAAEEFGQLDAWVNNAAVSVFGRLTEIPLQDFRRVLDVNISGYVHGARAALPHMQAQGSGVIINVASIVAEVSQPYTAAYSMSKAAVRALGVSLRSELLLDGATGVRVCTILPAAVDTPFFQHAANYTGRKVVAMPPVHTAARVARTIADVLKKPRREAVVGPAGRYMVLKHKVLPGLIEDVMAVQVDKTHLSRKQAAQDSSGNLYQPSSRVRAASVRGGWHGARRTAQRRAFAALAAAAGVVALKNRMR